MRQALDPESLKAIYNRAARRYDFQHSFLTAHADQRGRRLLVEKAVQSGNTVLDCGAGTGSTGLLGARSIGVSGKVILFDASEGMLEIAREKAVRAGVEDRVEIVTGDMLDLPFEDDSFDVVLSTYSMCPVDDPARAAMEVHRVTRPEGRIGVAHSADPESAFAKWLADRVENIVWRIPSISLGCRSVTVLPVLEKLGCEVVFEQHIGIPLWPFLVFVATKPAAP